MPEPIRIQVGLAGKHWPEAGRMILAHWLSSGPDSFGQNLAQSARTKSDPGWFCTILLSRTSGEERNRVWKWEPGTVVAGWLCPASNQACWFLHTSLLSDQTSLAKPWPGHLDQIRVSFAQYDPAFFGKMEQKRMWEVAFSIIWSSLILAACWPYPKCFQIGSGMVTGNAFLKSRIPWWLYTCEAS